MVLNFQNLKAFILEIYIQEMKKQYNIILGLALLATIAACYAFKKNKYYSIKTGEEVKYERQEGYQDKDDFNYLLRTESYLNYEAGFTAGITTLGLGLLLIGLYEKRKNA
jgi:hypothetical protein